jgi:hypothetical protein
MVKEFLNSEKDITDLMYQLENDIAEKGIASLIYHEIPLFTCHTFGRKIKVVGDIKFKDAEMYVDLKGYTRDKYKILSEGPKVIFFYDPHEDGKEKRSLI